ncbi:MAG: type II secretion system protein GspG [Bacteroidota bacterium]
MIEFILSTLAEFRLIREDYKHFKRISKKEKEDGIKRPLQKIFLQPSLIVVAATLVLVFIGGFLFFSYQSFSVYPRKTQKEIIEITNRIVDWNEKYGEFPQDLNDLIGNNPMRQEWKKDSWDRPYQYYRTESGKGFLIVSAGLDGKFDTEDDIKSE